MKKPLKQIWQAEMWCLSQVESPPDSTPLSPPQVVELGAGLVARAARPSRPCARHRSFRTLLTRYAVRA